MDDAILAVRGDPFDSELPDLGTVLAPAFGPVLVAVLVYFLPAYPGLTALPRPGEGIWLHPAGFRVGLLPDVMALVVAFRLGQKPAPRLLPGPTESLPSRT